MWEYFRLSTQLECLALARINSDQAVSFQEQTELHVLPTSGATRVLQPAEASRKYVKNVQSKEGESRQMGISCILKSCLL